jgi:hypothetical protein
MDKLALLVESELTLSEAQQDAFEVVRKLVLPQLQNAKRSLEGLELVVDVLDSALYVARKALEEGKQ